MKVKEASLSYLTKKKSYTYRDYLELPEDGIRYEIINGDLVMTPSPVTIHQRVSAKIEFELRKYIDLRKIGEVFDAPFDVVLSDEIVLQPDIFFISNEQSKIITENNISGAPDLIIEILSPSTGYYDLVEKKEIYEKFGVKEYWIVDPKKRWVEIYTNIESKFKLLQRLEKSGGLKSQVLDGLLVSLEKIFE